MSYESWTLIGAETLNSYSILSTWLASPFLERVIKHARRKNLSAPEIMGVLLYTPFSSGVVA